MELNINIRHKNISRICSFCREKNILDHRLQICPSCGHHFKNVVIRSKQELDYLEKLEKRKNIPVMNKSKLFEILNNELKI